MGEEKLFMSLGVSTDGHPCIKFCGDSYNLFLESCTNVVDRSVQTILKCKSGELADLMREEAKFVAILIIISNYPKFDETTKQFIKPVQS
jgi:hypothetical protein